MHRRGDLFEHMTGPHFPNYLRTFRLKSGLSQRELALLVGYISEGVISRHETSAALPPLLVAVCYEVIFRATFAELFPGLKDHAEQLVRNRISRLEAELEAQLPAVGDGFGETSQKLAWLNEQRMAQDNLNA
jgi:transcriptional regulator with XRE-family HTH domain